MLVMEQEDKTKGRQKITSDGRPPGNNHIAEQNEVRGGTSTSLKARGKIVKKSPASRLKKQKRRKPQANKGKHGVSGAKNMNTVADSKQKKIIDVLLPKNHIAENNGMDLTQKRTVDDESPRKSSISQSQGDNGKALQNKRNHRFEEGNQNDMESNDGKGKTLTNETRKERFGGLIFMCSGKTKPDCFRYHIMGVTNKKKGIVLGIKPGIKLFLFDFDLKLLYGIYNASSSGGIKLEPRAFGGAFPVQVRFNIVRECFPLPESVFKKAIKENYDGKNRFKTELTVKQVRKLIELFRPVGIHSLQAVHSPQKLSIPDNKFQGGVQGGRANSNRDALNRNHNGNADVKRYVVLSHGRDPGVSYQDSKLAWREEIPRDLFISEKEYRAYTLKAERRNLTPSSCVNPEQLETRYADQTCVHGVPGPHNLPASIDAAGGQLVSSFTNNHHYANRYGTSSAETLLHPVKEASSSSSFVVGGRSTEADILGRRLTVSDSIYSTYNLGSAETVQDRLYSRYSADHIVEYNQMPLNYRTQHELTSLPVSSRYSFPGPAFLFR